MPYFGAHKYKRVKPPIYTLLILEDGIYGLFRNVGEDLTPHAT